MRASSFLFLAFCLSSATVNLACGEDGGGSGGSGNGNTGGTSSGTATGVGGAGTGMGTGGAGTGTGGTVPFELTSTAFDEGGTWPLQYECGPPVIPDGPGMNVSPPLTWTPGPPETQSYAVVMRDLDAGGLIHWVIYDIPASTLALPEGIPQGYQVTDPAGAKQAEIQMVVHTYFGPCSPNSINTYQLTIHALDVPTLPGATMASQESELAPQIEAMSIASASLSGES